VFELVIFDCDGVLVDSEPVTIAVLVESLTYHGLEMDEAEIGKLFVGGTIASAAQEVERRGVKLPDSWVKDTYATMFTKLREHTPLIDGVLDLLDELDARAIPYAIGSNGPPEKMQITLGQNGLIERFKDTMFSGHVHAAPKPAPDLYLYAAQYLGAAPVDCVVVDDSPSGCTAAQRAGIPCFGFAERTAPDRLAAVGAMPVTSMDELAQKMGLA